MPDLTFPNISFKCWSIVLLVEMIQSENFPSKKSEMPQEISEFWEFRNNLTV